MKHKRPFAASVIGALLTVALAACGSSSNGAESSGGGSDTGSATSDAGGSGNTSDTSSTSGTDQGSDQSSTTQDSASSDDGEATDYPTGDIQIVVPFAAGGGTDAVGRAVAHSLSKILDQNVVVVNKTGGSGAVGMQDVRDAKPDGYTLLLYTGEVVTLPIQGIAQFDTFDFDYLATYNVDPGVMVVKTGSKYSSFDDVMDALKDNPGKLKYAASVVPDPRSLILQDATDTDYITVPYEGAAPAIKDLIAGEADFGMFGPGEVKEQVEGGNLTPVAVMGDDAFTDYKNFDSVPPMTDFGIDADFATYRGIAAPPGMPKPVVKKLEDALGQVAEDPDFVDFMNKSFLGLKYMNADETIDFIKKDQSRMEPVISKGQDG